ncbi:MAG TPA: ATP-binding protein [Aquabacterium sp.]|uniref:ATP-binding protein n=1 Tax=Aquabacterium sp. TaxID=1872578 RepID=UPI002E33B1FF|nr:ATP-binding protein [Aquabacterium sp.]HEX5356757.1 ATP-binding protein [Aquabacterium sp.]
MKPLASHSLRHRLLGILLGAITLSTVIQAVTAYKSALAQADVIFDRHMQKMAMSLRSGVPLVNAKPNVESSTDRANEDFVVQMWNAKGVPIFQSAAHRTLRKPSTPGFSDVRTLDARIYRVYLLTTAHETIQVAQDMAARRDMASTLAWHAVGPGMLTAPFLMLVVGLVVSRSLAPIANVRSQMASRKADDLSPVMPVGLPEEVRPLIDDLNLLLERVRQAFEAQKSFVADAAHELRSPLTALKIQVQGLQRAADEDARKLAVKRLTSGIDRVAHLVDQLLVLARQEACATAGVEMQGMDLAQTGLLALTDVLVLAQARQIDLGVHQANRAMVTGDPDALRILVRNLLDNSIKYTPSGGTVDLDVRQTPSGTVLSVEDNGPGIPEADRDRVLDRFYRLQGSGAEGSGLGLAIVKAIADAHGAKVLIDKSERLGGLRVQVRFKVT